MTIDITKYEGHTPGPWEPCILNKPINDVAEYVAGCIAQSGGQDFYFVSGLRDAGPVDICHVGNGPAGPVNVQLIADAPKLLAEVVRLRADLAEAVQTLDAIERALGMRFAPAEILDENSPIREGMRAVLAKHGGA